MQNVRTLFLLYEILLYDMCKRYCVKYLESSKELYREDRGGRGVKRTSTPRVRKIGNTQDRDVRREGGIETASSENPKIS